jgi:hypothetical protein
MSEMVSCRTSGDITIARKFPGQLIDGERGKRSPNLALCLRLYQGLFTIQSSFCLPTLWLSTITNGIHCSWKVSAFRCLGRDSAFELFLFAGAQILDCLFVEV